MIYLNLFLITLMVVLVLDISGFYEEMYLMVKRWLTKGRFNSEVKYIKPWSCSLCMSHHINLLYVIITGNFSLLIWAYILGLAVFTPIIKEFILFTRAFMLKVICELEEWFRLN